MVVTRKEIPLYPKPFREANVLNNLCYEGHPALATAPISIIEATVVLSETQAVDSPCSSGGGPYIFANYGGVCASMNLLA